MDFHTFAAEELSALARTLSGEAESRIAMARAETEAELARVKQESDAELAATRAAADAAAHTSGAFSAMVEKLREDQSQLVMENDRLAAENAALTWERSELLASVQTSHRGHLIASLTTVFERVAAEATIEGVLAAAAAGLLGDFTRVAVFTRDDRQFVQTFDRGFDIGSGLENLVISCGDDSFLSAFLGSAARSSRVQSFSGSEATPFGGTATLIVTVPIVVRGDTLAVLYADDSGRPADASSADDRMRLVALVGTHTALRLDRLTIELEAIAELRAYAHMLLDEVEYVYDGDAAATKPEAERIERLQDNLRCARQIYGQRVTIEGPAAATLLDEVILDTLDRKAAQPFGLDLRTALAQVGVPTTGAGC